jgi:phosphoribosylanthranilate isomerase
MVLGFSVNPQLNSNVTATKLFFFPDMSLKSIVKVSHISNLSDARYCAGMGVEMLGFRVIQGQEQYMAPGLFQDIRGWISGPAIIAELYGISAAAEVSQILQAYSPDYLELSYREYLAFGAKLDLPCIVYADDKTALRSVSPDERIAKIIVNEEVTCTEIAGIRIPVLSHVRSLNQLDRRMKEGCFQGYVLEGPQEIRPGVTNYDQLGVILEALEDES